jgi:hypothetical protein
VSVISLIIDGSNDEISAMTGKLGRVPGVAVKSMVTKNNNIIERKRKYEFS